ncbi:MAG: hypothetical protein DME56_08195 [Verrucomicrobia bacterium]|nr:MAG: hypothetical protein DME56_08195 [Verrucomicrobiota bacterium]
MPARWTDQNKTYINCLCCSASVNVCRECFVALQTEIDALNGYIARRGAELGVPVSVKSHVIHAGEVG